MDRGPRDILLVRQGGLGFHIGSLAHQPNAVGQFGRHSFARHLGDLFGRFRLLRFCELPDNGAVQWMSGLQGQIVSSMPNRFNRTPDRRDFLHPQISSGQGSGFIEGKGVHLGKVLNRRSSPENNPTAGTPGDRGQDRRWHTEHEGAGRGHDEHGDGAAEGAGHLSGIAQRRELGHQPPVEEKQGAADQHAGGVARAEFVGEALGDRLPLLGLADQLHDLLQGALGSGAQDLPDQGS